MTDILTITLNPAVDLATTAPFVTAGPKLRCGPVRTDPGGGGINVSRAIAHLGGQSRALVAIGGPPGKKLRQLLAAEGIAVLPFRTTGETRQSLAVTDDSTGEQYRFVLPGPIWDDERVAAVLGTITAAVPDQGIVVLSGSLPPGVKADFPHALCDALRERSARIIADTSGDALHRLAAATVPAPYVLRMDQAEAEELAERPLPDRADSAAFAAELVARGAAEIVIVARGADGSVMADSQRQVFVKAADVPVRSKIGAGDSFVGGFALSLSRGADPTEALRRGAAAASAAVMTDATELCHREDAQRLYADCTLEETGNQPRAAPRRSQE